MTYCNKSNQTSYPFILPDLPYEKESFKPHFTLETFDYHHGKHHNAYVQNLNNLLKDKEELHKKDLEEIIEWSSQNSNTAIFNNAAQIWNHTFFWHSIKPQGGGKPSGKILEQINKDFGNFEEFCEQFKQEAVGQFGSGWAWLVYHDNRLQIIKTTNAGTPIANGMKPLLACDVWEHAYYIDYRNKRPDYVDIFIKHMINWKFVEDNLIK
ncbi:superoxide dismutase [Rickettsia gravesii]|uniref:superoxide dismutase n=1 Tax=Rickettsia gravesii TaxID=354585 RepID=UPI000375EE97|nr:superoxide dismutase [Rickettsia gravesii]